MSENTMMSGNISDIKPTTTIINTSHAIVKTHDIIHNDHHHDDDDGMSRNTRKKRKAEHKHSYQIVYHPQNIHRYWQLPAICQFLWIFQDVLALQPIPTSILEQAFLQAEQVTCVDWILSSLFCPTQEDRTLIKGKTVFTRTVLNTLLSHELTNWSNGTDGRFDVAEEIVDELHYADVFDYYSLSLDIRIRILHALCLRALDREEMRKHFNSINVRDTDVKPFARDCDGARFFYFGFSDLRIYYQRLDDPAGLEADFGLVCNGSDDMDQLLKDIDVCKNPKCRALSLMLKAIHRESQQSNGTGQTENEFTEFVAQDAIKTRSGTAITRDVPMITLTEKVLDISQKGLLFQ